MDVECAVAWIRLHRVLQRSAASWDVSATHADHPRMVKDVRVQHTSCKRLASEIESFLVFPGFEKRPRQGIVGLNAVAQGKVTPRGLHRGFRLIERIGVEPGEMMIVKRFDPACSNRN